MCCLLHFRRLLVILVAMVLLDGASFGQVVRSSDDIRLRAAETIRVNLLRGPAAPKAQAPLLIELTNTTDRPIALNLGDQGLGALSLEVIDSHRHSSNYGVLNAGVVSGWVYPFTDILLPHTELSFPLSLSKIVPTNLGYGVLPIGPITIRAKLTGTTPALTSLQPNMKGIVTLPFWTGTAYSNSLRLSSH